MGFIQTCARKTGLQQWLTGALALGSLAMAARGDDKQPEKWWDNEWTMRKQVTIDANAGGVTDAVGTAPLLVRLYDANFQMGQAKDDGSDIRFVSEDGKTVLPHHIEMWDPLMTTAQVWVKPPEIKAGGKTTMWMYFKNLQGAKGQKIDDQKGTYDGNDVLVYHFAEMGQAPADVSGNNNHASNPGMSTDAAMIGAGLKLDGKAAVLVPTAQSPTLAWTAGGEMTWSAWVKPLGLKAGAAVFSRQEGSSAVKIGFDNGVPFVSVNGSQSPTGPAVPPNTWHHVAVTAKGGQFTVYLDGKQFSTLGAALPAMAAGELRIGSTMVGDDGQAGEMDEMILSKVARSAGYVGFLAASQGSENGPKVTTFGSEERGGASEGHVEGWFTVVLRALTMDGWIVIGILGVMLVMSAYVMITKISYLNGVSKGNSTFMNEWEHVATDLTVLDNPDPEASKTMGGRLDKRMERDLRHSSVFRIYHIGVEEIRHRLSEDNEGEGENGNAAAPAPPVVKMSRKEKGLAGRSIQAIRAALDGGLVRETQKINKLIVMLTICISGGPFLGLLGTVIGVMITFAEVARAGDVNVNAIAPGIAGALLATVAGLAVAIPSLFGYNYILSRVKDAKDDMHIFIDEFVSKMAEFYREPTA